MQYVIISPFDLALVRHLPMFAVVKNLLSSNKYITNYAVKSFKKGQLVLVQTFAHIKSQYEHHSKHKSTCFVNCSHLITTNVWIYF